MVHPKQFIKKVGYFDEHFYPAYFEDNDMAYRMQRAGLSDFRRTDAVMFHKGSVTQFWNGEEEGRVVSHEAFRRNERYYQAKWGGGPGQEKFSVPYGTGQYTIKDW
jgi:GT2 family glycosyltransferase